MIKLAITIGCLEIGGAETFVINLLKRLDYHKYRVLLLVLEKKYNTFLETEAERLPIRTIYLNKKKGFRPVTMIKITGILKKFKPDVVHGNVGGMTYLFLYIFLTKSVKTIHTIHTLANIEYGFIKRKILSRLYRKRRVIPVAISPAVKRSIVKTYRMKDEMVILIHNAVDISRFKTKRTYYYEKITIGHIGRYEPVKNHRTIIGVYRYLIKKYSNLSLCLIGNGSLFSEIEKEVRGLNNVTMIKKTTNVEKYLSSIDIFFLPSVYEGMPLSLLEAMAAGTVIVSTNVGGISDIVENGVNGYLIDDCFDIEAFVSTFQYLINDKEEMKAISIRNQHKAQDYDLKRLVYDYEKLYSQEAYDANGRV